MRVALILSGVLLAGMPSSPGRPRSTSYTRFEVTASVTSGQHFDGIGSLAVAAEALSLQWTTKVAGTGAGTATYELVSGEEVLCSVEVPCANTAGVHVVGTCAAGALDAGAHLDVQLGASGCAGLPAGSLLLALRSF